MKEILAAVITCFFALLAVLVVVMILQGIFYILYQKSDRRYLGVRMYASLDSTFFSLYHKGEQIDTIFLYAKHRGCFYALGGKGFYKFKRGRYTLLAENLREDEKLLFEEMKESARGRLCQYHERLRSFSDRYGTVEPDSPQSAFQPLS